MSQYRRKDARHYPILSLVPGSGTGIQLVPDNREQKYIVWNAGYIEQFCSSPDEAYFALQEVLDGNRNGSDWDEEIDDEDDFDERWL